MCLNNTDKEQVLMEIAEVRRTGWCNMLMVDEVISSLYRLGCDFSAETISFDKTYYLNTLLPESANY